MATASVQTFTFPLWLSLIPTVIALGLLGAGLWRRRRGTSSGWILMTAGFAFMVVFGPLLLLDRVRIDAEGLTQTTGFWFAPTVKGFRLAGTERVEIRLEEKKLRRGSYLEEIWYVFDSTGAAQRIDPGDLWSLHSDEIVEILRARGISVQRL